MKAEESHPSNEGSSNNQNSKLNESGKFKAKDVRVLISADINGRL